LRLSLTHHPGGATATAANSVAHDLDDGATLVWELGEEEPAGALLSAEVDLDPSTEWLMRCDRVDFQPGGIAYRHTHPGPGIRYLLFGSITIDSEGAEHTYGPGEPWFERGPDPVLATTAADEPSAFVRVMVLPAEWAGKRTITYVDPADADKPKTQKATIFLEQGVSFGRASAPAGEDVAERHPREVGEDS
jgi:quercetin dioxygenase-like cupin family protein